MSNSTRSEQILRDIRKVDMKVDTLVNKISYNIRKTKQEIQERKDRKANRR